MEKTNVVLIVVDTLREDASHALEELRSRGFMKYENAIAPAPWTLPAHASMFTGQLPSVHGVHEAHGIHVSNMASIAKHRLESNASMFTSFLKEKGYTSFGYTTNPIVSPRYGFNFDEFREFDRAGEATTWMLYSGKPFFSQAINLLRDGEKRLLLRRISKGAQARTLKSIGMTKLDEKGSRYMLSALRRAHFSFPSFIFLNIIEAHSPHFWKEYGKLVMTAVPDYLIKSIPTVTKWPLVYPEHATLAIRRALEAVEFVEQFDPLVIVTSDHGELLGEGKRYGHGFFLDDELLRVPLYVRYPKQLSAYDQVGHFVSLTEIREIIVNAIQNRKWKVGSDYVLAESFGSYDDISKLPEGYVNSSVLDYVDARRIRVVKRDGSMTKDVDRNRVEESLGKPIGDFDELLKTAIGHTETDKVLSDQPSTKGDDESLLTRLRELGYE
jgi:hypothetical protein